MPSVAVLDQVLWFCTISKVPMSGRRSIGVRKQVELTLSTWKRQRVSRAKWIATRAKVTRLRTRRRPRREADASPWTSYEQLEELNRTLSFTPLSEVDKERLEREAHEHANDTVLDRKVCVVTDTWVFPTGAECVDVDELPFRAMRAVLTGEPWRTQAIVDYYDCSDIDARLHGLLLSRRAFERGDEGHVQVWISLYALKDLQAVESRLSRLVGPTNEHKPPRFTIADGFVAGAFEVIEQANCIERQAVGLAQIRGVVKVVYGGPGNVLNSHLLCWDNRSATIAARVPSVITRDSFQLIIAGPMTSPQEVLLAKRHECNGLRVKQVHDLLRRINPLYAAIQVDVGLEGRDTGSSAITTRLDPQSSTDQLIVDARARQASVAHVPKRDSDVARCECTVVESETVLMETTPDRSEQDRLTRAVANVSNRTYVVHRSTTLLQTTDPFYMERLFPHLLTFGYGGFSTERHHRYSARSIVLHYLNVSTNRIAEDPLYKLVMFDYLSTKRVKSGVFLRVGQDPSLAVTAMRVTPSQLKVAMGNRTNQRNAWKQGRTFVPAVEAPSATALLKSINASTSKMWGSNEEREAMARKVDAMTIRYGAPSIFWTLTPNPDCSITCAFWTGRALPNGRPSTLADCTERNMPCSSDMAKMVMANTFVQAQYYKTCCHILLDVLFGWDTTSNKPKAQRGIFGFVEALVYALEQQGRLFIHHHGVAWIAGLPKTQSDWDRLLSSTELKDRFQRYCDSIFAAELPVYKSIGNLFCPTDGCEGSLTPIKLPKKFKHILKSFVPAPQVAKCDSCDENFTETDITSSVIETQWDELDDEHKAVSSARAIECIRHKFGGLSSDTMTSNVQLSRLLLKDQIHAWAHTFSCVKGRNNTKCRYNFFRELVDDTGFTSNDEIVYQRRLGNQWLNNYIPLWRRVFHFNMDARILWSGHCLQATRYALQYTVKRQTVLDNVAVVELAFKKRIDREQALDTTTYAQGVGRLMSLAYATSGVMEIGGPLATAILLEGEAVTFGCLFERLILLEGLNLLDDIDVQATIVTRNHEIYTETSIAKYIQRPRCLESWCWYDFCSWFQRSGSVTSARADLCEFESTDQSELREHLKQHNYRYLLYPRVPEIIGPRLPDSSRLRNEDYADQTELYYRMATLLYHPFRSVRDFF